MLVYGVCCVMVFGQSERKLTCYRCDAPLDVETVRKFKSVCDSCDAWVHCCRNCTLYDEFAHNNCSSPSTDWVGGAEKANYCAEFEFRLRDAKKGQSEHETEKAHTAWDSLFKAD